MTTKLPSIATRNAMAFVGAYGNFPSNCAYATRWAAQRAGVEFVMDQEERLRTGRYYRLTEEGQRVAATSPLAACLTWAAERGFRVTERRNGRKPKPGFIPLINRDTGATAWVSSGRCVYSERELIFEGKPSKLAAVK